MFNIQTDLALEASELLYTNDKHNRVNGVTLEVQENTNKDIKITKVIVENEEGAKQIGKPVGIYTTIESQLMKENNIETHDEIIKILAKNLEEIHKLNKDDVILVVGLGNWNVTPDALGPKVASHVLVTSHIIGTGYLPKEIENKVRYMSSVSPGVMGLTGIETAKIIKGVTDNLKPDLIIAIDALASRETSRLNSTIQISNTGISPGSGVGNKRSAITEETMGVPVIAIGVPTVVDAGTLVNDTMDKILELMIKNSTEGTEFYEMLNSIDSNKKHSLIEEVLNPYSGNMFVAPKEVGTVINRLSNIISNAINIAVHPGITVKDINKYFA